MHDKVRRRDYQLPACGQIIRRSVAFTALQMPTDGLHYPGAQVRVGASRHLASGKLKTRQIYGCLDQNQVTGSQVDAVMSLH